jgi:hypothetical protein
MSYPINPSSRLVVMLNGVTATGASSVFVNRADYNNHQIQVYTAGPTAQTFTVYTSNDASATSPIWTAIRDHTDVDATVAGYTGSTASGVINLTGAYPWLKVVSGTASTAPFTVTIFSNDLQTS